jgi:thiosulfate/3-mercaptopyruvate sulfurtransferase
VYTHPDYLVETDWLSEHLDAPDLRLFDVTAMLTSKFLNLAKERSFDEGHIPGARFLDVGSRDNSLSETGADLPWAWPDAKSAAKALGKLGIDNQSRVVLYAASPRPGVDNGIMWTTRAWWIMRAFGVDCAILNGGFERWRSEGLRVVTDSPDAHPNATFELTADASDKVALKANVMAALSASDSCIVDALPPASYDGTGQISYGDRKGHITGAINIPYATVTDENGRFLDAERLREVLRNAGALDSPAVITYCGGGIAATTIAFCLALLGHSQVSVYDGSLFEWTADPDAPMNTI